MRQIVRLIISTLFRTESEIEVETVLPPQASADWILAGPIFPREILIYHGNRERAHPVVISKNAAHGASCSWRHQTCGRNIGPMTRSIIPHKSRAEIRRQACPPVPATGDGKVVAPPANSLHTSLRVREAPSIPGDREAPGAWKALHSGRASAVFQCSAYARRERNCTARPLLQVKRDQPGRSRDRSLEGGQATQ